MKRDYIRKAIFSVFMLATLCQSIPSYLFDDRFHDFISIELDIYHENESENENEEQNKLAGQSSQIQTSSKSRSSYFQAG